MKNYWILYAVLKIGIMIFANSIFHFFFCKNKLNKEIIQNNSIDFQKVIQMINNNSKI